MGRLVGPRELVKLSAEQMRRLHGALDARWNDRLASSRREGVRLPFQQTNVQLVVRNPMGEREMHLVQCRDLSERGMGAISVSFVYPGSACSVMLDRRDGEREMLTGVIANCVHVQQRLHRIGIRFSVPIEVAAFVNANATRQRKASE